MEDRSTQLIPIKKLGGLQCYEHVCGTAMSLRLLDSSCMWPDHCFCVPFNALNLLAGWQEEQLAYKNPCHLSQRFSSRTDGKKTSTSVFGDGRISTHADPCGSCAGRFVWFWASGELLGDQIFPKMWDSLPRTPMNHRAKLYAASFILGGEIHNCTNTHTHTHTYTHKITNKQ